MTRTLRAVPLPILKEGANNKNYFNNFIITICLVDGPSPFNRFSAARGLNETNMPPQPPFGEAAPKRRRSISN